MRDITSPVQRYGFGGVVHTWKGDAAADRTFPRLRCEQGFVMSAAQLGFAKLLVDFCGSGGSSGTGRTIGVRIGRARCGISCVVSSNECAFVALDLADKFNALAHNLGD